MGFMDDAKDKIKDVSEDVKDKAQDAGEKAKDWADDKKDSFHQGTDHQNETDEDHKMPADELEHRVNDRSL